MLSDTGLFSYKRSGLYSLDYEGGVLWSDPDIVGIDWPVREPILPEKDLKSPRLKDVKAERLPKYGNG